MLSVIENPEPGDFIRLRPPAVPHVPVWENELIGGSATV
jgi:hypothetical protein